MEGKLHETEQMNSLLLSSSTDVIIKLSADLKILEFNHEAENFFGKKRENILNQYYIQIFIPEPIRKKIEKDLKKLMKGGLDGKFKMQVVAARGKILNVEWSVNLLLNDNKIAVGMIIINKKINKP
jgi:PAS domain S-box-containing protein